MYRVWGKKNQTIKPQNLGKHDLSGNIRTIKLRCTEFGAHEALDVQNWDTQDLRYTERGTHKTLDVQK